MDSRKENVSSKASWALLLRGGLASAFIQGLNRLLTLALAVLLARLLGASDYGAYAFAFALMSLSMIVAEAGVPLLLMREIAAGKGLQNWGIVRGVVVRGSMLVMAAAFAVMLFGIAILLYWRDSLDPDRYYTFLFMLFAVPVASLARAFTYALRGLHRVVLSQVLELLLRPAVIFLLILTMFVVLPVQPLPQYAMLAQLIAASTFLVAAGAFFGRLLPPEARIAPCKYNTSTWLRSAITFAFIGGAGIINNQADIIILGLFYETDHVGIYRVAVQGATVVNLGLQACNAIAAPQFATINASGDRAGLQRFVTTTARAVILVALPLAICLIAFGREIVTWLFGGSFASAHMPLSILVGAQVASSFFGSVGFLLNMTGHERDSARILWLTAALNLILNFALIPMYGMVGAALSSAASLVLLNFLLFRCVRSHLKLNPTIFRLAR